MESYDIQPDGPLTQEVRAAIRAWFEHSCPLPWLEVGAQHFALFPDEAQRALALDRPEEQRIDALHTTASVALMDSHILLLTVRDPVTGG